MNILFILLIKNTTQSLFHSENSNEPVSWFENDSMLMRNSVGQIEREKNRHGHEINK